MLTTYRKITCVDLRGIKGYLSVSAYNVSLRQLPIYVSKIIEYKFWKLWIIYMYKFRKGKIAQLSYIYVFKNRISTLHFS